MENGKTSRRDFFKAFAQSSAVLAVSGMLSGCRPKQKQPNILFCISDDQSYPHTGAYGCLFVQTPAFDRVAREGILFHRCFVSTPSCCPSRASVLSGQAFYRLRETSMNHTVWPGGIPVYTDLLAGGGYHVGYTGKGWGPGNWKASGRTTNPVGREYNAIRKLPSVQGISAIDYSENFKAFLSDKPEGAPFCF